MTPGCSPPDRSLPQDCGAPSVGGPPDGLATDGELLRLFVSENASGALAGLVQRYAGLVHGVALRRSGQHELAEEVAQNVFAALARKAPALLRARTPLAAWLHRAAVLESAHALRKELTRQRMMKKFVLHAEIVSPPGLDVLPETALPALDEALDRLPRADRELLLARYFAGQSYRDIAAETGRSEAALMQQHHRALEKLSRFFRQRGIAASSAVLAAGLGAPLASAAPAGLASSVAAAAATATVPALALSTSLQLTLAMFTKTQIALTTAAVYLAAGTGAFVVGRSQGLDKEEGRLALALSSASATAPPAATSREPMSSAAPAPARAGLPERLAQAVAAWRAASGSDQKQQALNAIDALAPEEIAEAFAFLESLRGEEELFRSLAQHLLMLRALHEPEAALAWLGENMPRGSNAGMVKAIISGWAERDPQRALAWWEERMEALDFPMPEGLFELLPELIFKAWAKHDPGSLIDLLNATPADDPHQRLMKAGLGEAIMTPASEALVAASLDRLQDEDLKIEFIMVPIMMTGMVNPAKAREQALAAPVPPGMKRNELLMVAAFLPVFMQEETGGQATEEAVKEICAWARQHMDTEEAVRALEGIEKEFNIRPETLVRLKAGLSTPTNPSDK